MIETAHTEAMRKAYEVAHEERAKVFRAGLRWIWSLCYVPLSWGAPQVLTAPSR